MSQLRKLAVFAVFALVFGLLSSTMSMTASAAPITSPAGPRLMSQEDASTPEEVVEEPIIETQEEATQPEIVEEVPDQGTDPVDTDQNTETNTETSSESEGTEGDGGAAEVPDQGTDPVDTDQNTETNTDTETDESTDPQESEGQPDPDDVPVEVPATDEEEIPDEEPDGEYFVDIRSVSFDCSTSTATVVAFSSHDEIAIGALIGDENSFIKSAISGRLSPGAEGSVSISFDISAPATTRVQIQGNEAYRGNLGPHVFDCSGGTDPEPDPPVLSVSQSGCTGINVSRSGGEDGVVYTITVTVNDVIVATFDASTQLVPATLVTGDVVGVSTPGATPQSITVTDCDDPGPEFGVPPTVVSVSGNCNLGYVVSFDPASINPASYMGSTVTLVVKWYPSKLTSGAALSIAEGQSTYSDTIEGSKPNGTTGGKIMVLDRDGNPISDSSWFGCGGSHHPDPDPGTDPDPDPGHEGPVLGNPPVMPEAPLPAKVDTVSADSQATTLPVTGSVPVSRDSDLLGYLFALAAMAAAVAFGVRRGRGVFHG